MIQRDGTRGKDKLFTPEWFVSEPKSPIYENVER